MSPTAIPSTAPPADSAVEDLPGFTHRYADVNGTGIHYVVGGEGPVVVLLHGFPYSWAQWRHLMLPLAKAGFTALAPDLRGMGDSTPAENGSAKTNVAEDVRQIVHGLAFGAINLVGGDIGTMVAYAYASRHPDEVRRLVLAESVLPGFGLEDVMNPATGGYWHFGFHAQVDVASYLTRGKEDGYLMPSYKMMSAAPDAEELARTVYLPHYTGPRGLRGGFQHYAPLVQDIADNRAAFARKLPLPVLVLNGEKGIPQDILLKGAREAAEHVEADMVPDSGHTFAHDNPSWVAERLVRFFG